MKKTFWLLALLPALLCGSTWAQTPPAALSIPPEQQQRLDTMRSKSVDASLTILPVCLGGRPFDRVSQVVGVLLEKQGLKTIELGKAPLDSTKTDNMADLSTAVGASVRAHPVTTDYALYAEFNDTRATGLNELRAVVVDKAGSVVWTDRQTPQDEAFRKLEQPDPMALCVLLVQRLSPQLGLNDETAKAAKPGKLEALLNEQSGLPSKAELDASRARQEAMKLAVPKVTLLVYPARVGGTETSVASAMNVVQLLNEAGLCKAVRAEQAALVKPSQADPNEQKMLWSLAREFRDYIRAHPPETEYALYAEYAFNPQNANQGFVHFIVCDRKGEWVIVEFQNSHHPDYQSIGVTSRARCDNLLVKRLQSYLQ